MTDTTTYEPGQKVRLLCDPKYKLGVMRDLGQTNFNSAVANGTIGTYKGHYDDLLTHPDTPRLGRHWHVIEVEVHGETMLAPLADRSFEPIELTRLVRDEDCPACGWGETYAEVDLKAPTPGAEAHGCSHCGWRSDDGEATDNG